MTVKMWKMQIYIIKTDGFDVGKVVDNSLENEHKGQK